MNMFDRQYELWAKEHRFRMLAAMPGERPDTITLNVSSGGDTSTMTPERCLQQFGAKETCLLLSTQGREKWMWNKTKDDAKKFRESWRKRALKDGFIKLLPKEDQDVAATKG